MIFINEMDLDHFESFIHHLDKQYTENPLSFLEPKPVKIQATQKKEIIQISIQTLQDLVLLADYPFDKKTEYNIDFVTLQNIRPELQALNDMIGMLQVKNSLVEQILYFMQNLHSEQDYKHILLLGEPGTGKTELAKLMGRLFLKMGILKNDTFKKVTRNDLVGGYLGQTALKTKEVIQQAMGGVLFIDEAYSLACQGDKNDSYAKECIDILCEAMSDSKSQWMVIAAGYEQDMIGFLKSNSGLESRFMWRYVLPPYKPEELLEMFIKKVTKQGWSIGEDEKVLQKWFFNNASTFKAHGRDIEKWLTLVKIKHARRVYGKIEGRKLITLEDMQTGWNLFVKQKMPDSGLSSDVLQSLYI